ncbi:MAG: phage antirepressor KilAC domain-containing protein [Synergistaceae bacterium]|nr:phage antirepressor KilAC domain-containing protein [Synergistaceae bacterium]
MNLLMTKEFNGVALDCYKAENQEDGFWATREQIGRLLGYEQPDASIRNIHSRNTDRLNKFSTRIKLIQVEGSRTVTREVTVYNFKGLLEICRYSNQPKANDVMDFLWNVADEIRKHGFYATPQAAEQIIADPDSFIKVLTALKFERAKATRLEQKNVQLEAKIEEDKPKVMVAEALDVSSSAIDIGTFAKILKQNGVDIGQKRLFQWFRGHGWLMNTSSGWNLPTQKAMNKGFFVIKESVIPIGNRDVAVQTAKITGSGQNYFLTGFLSGDFES